MTQSLLGSFTAVKSTSMLSILLSKEFYVSHKLIIKLIIKLLSNGNYYLNNNLQNSHQYKCSVSSHMATCLVSRLLEL